MNDTTGTARQRLKLADRELKFIKLVFMRARRLRRISELNQWLVWSKGVRNRISIGLLNGNPINPLIAGASKTSLIQIEHSPTSVRIFSQDESLTCTNNDDWIKVSKAEY